MWSILLLLSCAVVNELSAGTVINLQRCKAMNENCMTNIAKTAYPLILEPNKNIGAEEMDPMYQEIIKADLPDIKFTLRNITIKGFRSCEVQSAKLIDKSIKINFLCQKFHVFGKYDAKGSLMTIKIEGNGDFNLESGQYKLIVDLDMETETKDGKDYKQVKSFKFQAQPLENLKMELRNLFDGKKDLGDAVNRFMNENSKEVILILQDPVFRPNIKKVINNANKYFNSISTDQYLFQ